MWGFTEEQPDRSIKGRARHLPPSQEVSEVRGHRLMSEHYLNTLYRLSNISSKPSIVLMDV